MNDEPTLSPRPCRTAFGRWRRRVIAFVFVVGVIWIIIVGPWALHCAEAETDAIDPGWRMAEIEAARAVIPDEENSALVITAGNKLVPPNGVKAFELVGGGDATDLSPAERLSEATLANLRNGLNAYRASLQQYARLDSMPRGRWPAVSPDPAQVEISQVTKFDPVVNTCAWVLLADLCESIESGDDTRSLRRLRAILNCGRSIGDEPSTLSMLKRMHVTAMMLQSCERLLAQRELDEAKLVNLQQELETESSVSLIRIAMRGERAFHFEFLDNLNWRARILVCNPRNPLTLKLVCLPGMVAARQAELLPHLNDLVAITQQPTEAQEAMAQLWCLEGKEWERFDTMSMHRNDRHFTSNLNHEAKLRTMIVALAAERYRAKEHRWPATLDDLVSAKLLREVPNDPFTGKPVLWTEWAQGRIVYSVGKNRVDNGGKTQPVKFDAGDVGYLLFNPDHRRQPAATPAKPPG